VIENRAGGGGTAGGRAVANAEPDGYTLLFGSTSSVVVAPAVAKEAPYDPVTAFTPIIQVARGPFILSVRSDLPINNLAELIDYAKRNPGKLNYGSSGPGSSPHLATELLLSLTGMQMTHIPFKGIAPAITAQLANEVQLSLTPIAVGMPHARAGRLRAIAQAGLQRSVAVPDLSTVDESGVPGFEVIGWWGMLAPAKTPRPIVVRLNREIRAVLDLAEVRRILIEQGMDPAAGTPEQFAALIKSDMDKWGDIGKRLGVKLD
jgi:tripartite-type tricarboxylate transporter receptor subunit TctC